MASTASLNSASSDKLTQRITVPIGETNGQNEMEKNGVDETDVEDASKKKKDFYDIDGRYGWVQVFSSSLIFVTIAGMQRSFSLIYEQLLIKYGKSAAATAWVPSIHGLVRFCSSPLIGYLVKKYRERIVCFVGAVMCGASILLMAFAPTIEIVYLSYGLLYGIATNACLTSGLTIVTKAFDKKRGKAMGVVFSFFPLGTLVLSPLLQFLFKEYDYFGAVLILSAVAWHPAISAMMMRPPPNPKPKQIEDETADDEEEIIIKVGATMADNEDIEFPRSRTNTMGSVIQLNLDASIVDVPLKDDSKRSDHTRKRNKETTDEDIDATNHKISNVVENGIKQNNHSRIKAIKSVCDKFGVFLMKDYHYSMYCALMAFFVMGLDLNGSFLSPVVREKGYSDGEVLITFMVFTFFDIPCRLLSGVLFDHRFFRNHKYPLSAFFMFSTAFFQLLFPLALDVNFILAMTFFALGCGCRALAHSQHTTVIAEMCDMDQLEAAFGINRFFQGLGIFVSAPLGGFLKDFTGTYVTGYIVTSALLIFTCFVYFFIFGVSRVVNRLRSK